MLSSMEAVARVETLKEGNKNYILAMHNHGYSDRSCLVRYLRKNFKEGKDFLIKPERFPTKKKGLFSVRNHLYLSVQVIKELGNA